MKSINSEVLKHEIKQLLSNDLRKQDKVISLINRYIKFADDMFIKEINIKTELKNEIKRLNDLVDNQTINYQNNIGLLEKTLEDTRTIAKYLEDRLFNKGKKEDV